MSETRKAPRTVGKLIELLSGYPANRRISRCLLELRVDTFIADVVVDYDPGMDSDEAEWPAPTPERTPCP